MADLPLSAVVQRFRRATARHVGGDRSDAALLTRYIRNRDGAAFEVLVWRHAGMVLGACRRLLRHEQDAEDAFQATFLTLARQAAAVGRREALGAWLYRVAYRIVLKAKRRRAAAPVSLATEPASRPAQEAVWSDLRPVLDEEVLRLPVKYREAFVLCALEGLTHTQAARELGCPVGMVDSRLAWARQRLRGRLSRRGVTLSAGAFLAGSASELAGAALPRGLIGFTLAVALPTATGTRTAVAPAVSGLIEGGGSTVVRTTIEIAAALLFGAGLVFGGGAWFSALTPPAPPAEAERPPRASPVLLAHAVREEPAARPEGAEPMPPTGTMNLNGIVRAADGTRVRGATVYLVANDRLLATATTDAGGAYLFRDAKLPLTRPEYPGGDFAVFATAPGHGLAWHRPRLFVNRVFRYNTGWQLEFGGGNPAFLNQPNEMSLRFSPAAECSGRVIDDAGRPVAKARVRLTFCDAVEPDPHPESSGRALFLRGDFSVPALSAETDRDGRFTLGGLPPESLIQCSVRHADFAERRVYAALTDAKLGEEVGFFSGPYQDARPTILTKPYTVTLTRPRSALVELADATSGKGVAGLQVMFHEADARIANRSGYRGEGVTDKFGLLDVRLPPGRYQVWTPAPEKRNYLPAHAELTIRATGDAPRLRLRLRPGFALRIEALDAESGKPVQGAAFGRWWSMSGARSWFRLRRVCLSRVRTAGSRCRSCWIRPRSRASACGQQFIPVTKWCDR